MRTWFFVTIALLYLPALGMAQSLPSRSYMPIDHWAMPFLEFLVERQVIKDPTPMERPWIVRDIADALEKADTTRLTGPERRMLAQLRQEVAPRVGDVVFSLELEPGFRASTHGRRDPVREAGEGRAQPVVDGHIALEFGNFVMLAHRNLNWHLRDDPDYRGDKGVPFQGRADEAYGAFRSRYIDLEFGTLSRNWGPASQFGLQVSPVPYSYDHFLARLGVERFNLVVFIARLDELANRFDEVSTRWWLVHRLNIRFAEALHVAISQSSVVSGPARGLDLGYLNPFRFAVDTRSDTRENANNLVELGAELRVPGLPRLGLAFLIDDQINCIVSAFCPRDQGDEPPSYGFTGSLDGRLPGGSWSLSYTQVGNLTYRTPDPSETLMLRGIGLARNFSDYDQTTLKAQWMVAAGFLVGAEGTVVRQGEGDFRLPFPTREEYDTTPTLFAGVVERTWRGALHVSLAVPGGPLLRGNVGAHRITNAAHMPGATDDTIVGSVEARWRLGWSWLVK